MYCATFLIHFCLFLLVATQEAFSGDKNHRPKNVLYKLLLEVHGIIVFCNKIVLTLGIFYRAERGFDFAIRTPCVPSRWEEYDAEMAMAWEV